MEAISETRTTIERGQIAQKLESGYYFDDGKGAILAAFD